MLGLIKKIFGTAQSRKIKSIQKIVSEVNTWDEKLKPLSDEELVAKTTEFQSRLENGETLDDLLPEAYGVVKNACRRLCGKEVHVSGYDQKWDMVPYDVQILGAIAMHQGSITEMHTGEGKTLTAAMPLYLNALTKKPVHLVTVNDYLAKRDSDWIGTIFTFLGLTTKALTNDIPPDERKEIYAADIVYGTASEFGFDYLRDNSMAHSKEEQCQRGFFFAIIDEVDSILIDEARTPLIISGPSASSKQMYDSLKSPIASLVRLQRDACSKLATEARKTLEKLGQLDEEPVKASKEDLEKIEQAYKNLWLVNKGTPKNKILKRLKENPDVRAQLEKWETYFYGDANKQERLDILSDLYIIIDERSSDYELTDKGIGAWASFQEENHEDDFMMLDLGHEYGLIDDDTETTEEEKLQKKVQIREEDSLRKEKIHNVRQLFRAHLLLEKDVDYIVQDGKIVIIDENTGRPQPGRRFSDGLHQSIEAKESLQIQQETQTYATITLQNYFRQYDKLAGMTGTALTEASEFKEIYSIDVLEIPTNRPCVRKDIDDEIYMSEREKYNALIKDIIAIHKQGRPILVGTESVEISQKLSRILKQNDLPHTVLNAKNHGKEAEIIANAGSKGSIIVATNMAGRGTDIKLKDGVVELGGLHVIGTTRHQSRRIDRQLRGRCARQGDPGSSKFYVSFEDELMRLFTSPKLSVFLQRIRPPEGEAISAGILNRSIETAQKRVEGRNFAMRKHTLEYDDVMNKQRQEVYSFRNELLHSDNPVKLAEGVLEEVVLQLAFEHLGDRNSSTWDPEGFRLRLMTEFPISIEPGAFSDDYLSLTDIEDKAIAMVIQAFQIKLNSEANLVALIQKSADKEIEPVSVLLDIVRNILLRIIDKDWQDHLLAIDHLRTEVGMRVVGQKDPLQEFKQEAFSLFDRFSTHLKLEIAHSLFKFQMVPPDTKEFQNLVKKLQELSKQSYFLQEEKNAPTS